MQRKQVKTAAHRVKSSARRSVGKMTGNKDMEKQGKVEKAVAGRVSSSPMSGSPPEGTLRKRSSKGQTARRC